MRKLITGVDHAGRSSVVEEVDAELAGDPARPGRTRVGLFELPAYPWPVRPAAQGELVDLGVGPGQVRWQVISFEPHFEMGMHHTDTLDFDMILEGGVDIVLDDGPHWLGPGDCVVVTGIDHGWKAGPDGFVMAVTTLGTPPRA